MKPSKLLVIILLLSFVLCNEAHLEQLRFSRGYDSISVDITEDHQSGYSESKDLFKEDILKGGFKRDSIEFLPDPPGENQGDQTKWYLAGSLEAGEDGYVKVAEAVLFNYMDGQDQIDGYDLPEDVLDFVKTQLKWMKDQSNNHISKIELKQGKLLFKGTGDPIDKEAQFWLSVDWVLLMVRGMYDSFVDNGTNITLDQFLALPYMADMEDLLNKFDFQNGHPEKIKKKNMGDCTIVVKDINNEEEDDIYIAHNTHNVYSIMLRLFKSVRIEWDEYSDFMKAKTMRFSSRHGGIASKDDFYALDSGIVAMESSILIYNKDLYKRIFPESVPYFVSVTVANWMSDTNEEWIENYLNHYGGTHIAQWVLIDTKKEKYSSGSINVLDAIMGDSESFDVSKEFKAKGYWGGYNVPYSSRIFQECHYDPINHGYNTDERARIIARMIDQANTPESVRSLIRYNGNPKAPCGSISPRCDLSEKGGSAFGAIDSKYTQASWIKDGSIKILGVGGPMFNEEEGFPPFKFSGRYKDIPHRETPKEYSFGWHEIFNSNAELYSS